MPAEKVYVLVRVIAAIDGKGRMVLPLKTFSSAQLADEAARHLTEVLQQAMRCLVVEETSDSGVRLGGFLQNMLGIAGFQHVVDVMEVHHSNLVAPPTPSLIIPG